MALTRKLLKGMGLTEEQVDTIIEAHTDTVDGLKADVEKYKADAKDLASVQKKLEQAQADLEAGKNDSYKGKYDSLKKEFEDYKADIEAKQTKADKESAYLELLKAAGVSEKMLNRAVKASAAEIEALEFDEDGTVKDKDTLTKNIKEVWGDCITQARTGGANPATPPANNPGNGSMTKEQIMSIKDAGARQKAIAENPVLFGITI